MSKIRHENPYREGTYNKLFAYWQKKQVVTRQELIDYGVKTTGETIEKIGFDVNVLLSPRKTSKRGDCRGNISARGDLHYAEKLGRQVRAGVKEHQKFRLRWRDIPLERKTRKNETVAVQEKAKVAVKVTTPAPIATDTEAKA